MKRNIILAALIPVLLISMCINACFMTGKLYRVPSFHSQPGDYVSLIEPDGERK